jgi:fatty-acyl-CoA synthase
MNSSSHVRGDTTAAIDETTIGAVLERSAVRWPDVEMLVSVEQRARFTFAEFNRRVDALGAGLLMLGLKTGDRVGVWAPNCVEWALLQFATARIGLIQVNINPAYRLTELEFTLNKVGVKALIAADAFKSSDYLEMAETLAPEITAGAPGELRAARLPCLRAVIKMGPGPRPGWLNFADVMAADGGASRREEMRRIAGSLDRYDAINIQFTSGTTGRPKGATLSHRNLVNNAQFVGASMGLREGDRLCVPVPLYHCFGMVMSNLACVKHGATIVYPSPGFDPLAVLEAVQAERCTGLQGVPTMFIAELEHPRFAEFDLSSLRGGIMAGSPCPIEVMRRVVERMHMREITIAYGMTETSPVSFQSSTEDPLERRVSTVGFIQPHMEAKVIDPEGNTLPTGAAGQLCTRGYAVMRGYWDEPEKTAEAIDPDGWMHTGDLGVIHADGYCNIVGRATDMIIRGGENVYPREVEEFLFKHPHIQDVTVVGVPDDKFGEEICAWVKLRAAAQLTEEDVKTFCRGQVAHYKIPRYVVFVKEFPTTVTGKIQKYLIRQEMIERLAVNERPHA